MTKPKYHVGIDPGVNTGVAVWNRETQSFESVRTMRIDQAIMFVHSIPKEDLHLYHFVVEDARQRKHDPGMTDEKRQGAGSIKRDSKIWDDFLKSIGASYKMKKPNGKLNRFGENEPLWKLNTGWTNQTSKHARDASMLVWKA